MAFDSKEYHRQYMEKNRAKLNEYSSNYYYDHKEERKEYRRTYWKEYHQKERQLVLEQYGGTPPRCACCGETEIMFLTLDHINGYKYPEFARSGHHLYRNLRLNGYPDGYRVLCYNCNCSIGNFGYCPHTGVVANEKC